MGLREIKKHFHEDIATAMARDPSAESKADVVFFSTGMRAIWAYRRQHWLWAHGLRGLAVWLSKRSRRKFGVEIHPAAQIGRRFVIDHGMGVVVGSTAIIGDDCLMYQGVTLGMTGKHGGKRHPTVGNGVMLGAGAIVLGNIQIGDRARVAAGSVVVKEVPNDTTVAGNPAVIVRDRRKKGLELVSGFSICDYCDGCDDDTGDIDMDDENIRWSCAL